MNVRLASFVAVAALLVAAACDSGSNAPSPTSPAFSTESSGKDGTRDGTKTTTTTVKGAVTGLTGACPTLTFTVGGKTIKTSAATTYGDRACADVKNDQMVGVLGTAQADGSILAAQVIIAAPEPVPAVTGSITALAGTCPTLTLTVGGKAATTTSATVFSGKTCAQLAVGVEVAIYGSIPTGGSTIVATIVRSKK